MITNLSMVQNARRARNGKPNQIKIVRRRNARKMVVVRIATSLHRQKMKSLIQTMRQRKRDAARRKKRNSRPRRPAAEQLIQVRFQLIFNECKIQKVKWYLKMCIL